MKNANKEAARRKTNDVIVISKLRQKIYVASELWVRLARRETGLSPPACFILTVRRGYFFCGSFVLFTRVVPESRRLLQ